MSSPDSTSLTYRLYPPSTNLRALGKIHHVEVRRSNKKLCPFLLGHHNAISKIRYVPGFSNDNGFDKPIPLYSQDSTCENLRYGGTLFTASRDGTIRQWKLQQNLKKAFFNDSSGPPIIQHADIASVMVGHNHWVNDFCVIPVPTEASNFVVSCSNDYSIKVWKQDYINPRSYEDYEPSIVSCCASLNHHTDYVTSLAAASKQTPVKIVSAGLDKRVVAFDFNAKKTSSQWYLRHRGSILELLRHGASSVAVVAVTDDGNCISGAYGDELFFCDPRTPEIRTQIPEAHSSMIRCLSLRNDGYHAISAATDATIRLWDLRKPSTAYKIIHLFDSIWSLWADKDSHSIIFAGDRSGTISAFRKDCTNNFCDKQDTDNCIWTTRIRLANRNDIPEPLVWSVECVMSLEVDTGSNLLWASSGDSSVSCWNVADILGPQTQFSSDDQSNPFSQESNSLISKNPFSQESTALISKKNPFSQEPTALISSFQSQECYPQPNYVIPGYPKVREARLLRDERTVVTQSVLFDLESWDIIKGVQLERLPDDSFEEAIARLTTFVSRSRWCTVDSSLGALKITLSPATAFSTEAAIMEGSRESSINFGCAAIDRVFKNLLANHSEDIPTETHLSCQESPCCCVAINDYIIPKLTCKYELPDDFVILPQWLTLWLKNRSLTASCLPANSQEIGFLIRPTSNSVALVPLNKTRLCRDRCTSMLALADYILGHVSSPINDSKKLPSTPPTFPSSSSTAPITPKQTDELTTLAKNNNNTLTSPTTLEHRVTLYCMDEPLDLTWDLGTVKDLVWKKKQSPGQIQSFEILYSYKDPCDTPSKPASLTQRAFKNSKISKLLTREK